MSDLYTFLEAEGVDKALLNGVKAFREHYPTEVENAPRVPDPEYYYYGKKTWELALAAILAGKNLLLAGPKATGKNVLCENLGALFGRPVWNVSFHINTDAFRRSLDVPGYEKIDLRPETRFIATMNYGYAGTRDLNEALTSRFAVLDMPVITEDNLQKLIARRYPGISPKIRDQLVRLYGELERKAESAEISDAALDLRGLLDAIALMEQGLRSGDALDMCIVNKSFDAYERGLIRDVIAARVPADLTRADVFPT